MHLLTSFIQSNNFLNCGTRARHVAGHKYTLFTEDVLLPLRKSPDRDVDEFLFNFMGSILIFS